MKRVLSKARKTCPQGLRRRPPASLWKAVIRFSTLSNASECVKKPDKIPAVTHVDGTGRLQTVSKNSNSLYYELISEFYKLTNVPVIINTSMNVKGEPIVNTPEQAYNMLLKTDMDCVMLGNFKVVKNVSRS